MDSCVGAFEYAGEGVFSVSEEALLDVLERLFVLEAVEQAGLLDDTRGMLAVQSYLEYSDDVDSFSGLAEVAVESLKCAAGEVVNVFRVVPCGGTTVYVVCD